MGKARDAEETRAVILGAAFDAFYRQGYHATSVDEIVEKAKLTKGAFYHHFSTKDELGYAIADEILTDMMLTRWIKPLTAYRNPIKGIIARYRKLLLEETSDEEIGLGCPLNNLTQEMSAVDPIFRAKLRGVLEAWIEETAKHLKRAQAGGYLKPGVNVRQVAEFIVMTEEGSAALMKNMRDRRVYQALYEGFKQYMEAISLVPAD